MSVRSYFDLSQPVSVGSAERPAHRAASAPGAAHRPAATAVATMVAPPPAAPAQQMSIKWQVATYLILLVSILASRFIDLFRAGVAASFALDWRYLLFVGIASLLAFPVVYDKARLNKDQPAFLQICLIFTAGMGWEKILATALGK